MKFTISLSKMTEVLSALGFIEVDRTESHVQFVHFDGRETSVPNCEEISADLFRNIVLDVCKKE